VAIARAFCLSAASNEHAAEYAPRAIDTAGVSAEVARFKEACSAAGRELDDIIARVSRQVGEQDADIFRAHRLLLADPALVDKVEAAIANRHVDAATALQVVLEEYTTKFSQIRDDYLRKRAADVRDVIGRIQARITGGASHCVLPVSGEVMIVAPEVLPSQIVALTGYPVAGIVTERGGRTGHAAILARSLGIPAAAGFPGLMREVHTGDMLVLDACEGLLFVNPGTEVEGSYRKRQHDCADLRKHLIAGRYQPAEKKRQRKSHV